ncbi:FadR/GntR family transcriptional regulator [Mycoavidus sp. B2-EB]|uniref:FadR/GntR family transcriptional regulator n=1 Tax=Mycoavidus sp. B2-EB TaxID=2651972 RepID=UPI001627CAA1|nr:FadR/GntR family transcriptional regulator [Mycoavidus sp. B2-EB]BBO59092.1 GntR family transcriptional regulator [Mycoavidus sp. B2-EB]
MAGPQDFKDAHTFRIASVGTLADRVTQVLAQKIRSQELRPDSRLTEHIMAKRFGVSRTVIREAISRLKSDGLVEARQGLGTVVLQPGAATAFRIDVGTTDSLQTVFQVFELRRSIEGEAAALAAQRCTPEQLVQIKQALAAIDGAAKKGDVAVDEDFGLHKMIALATGNALYASLLDFLNRFIYTSIKATRTTQVSRMDFSLHAEHRAIIEAIARADPDAARRAAIAHIDNATARVRMANLEGKDQ